MSRPATRPGPCCAALWLVLSTLLAAAVPGCRGGDDEGLAASPKPAAAPDEARPPNVLLITLDTLRADHLGCYGYERTTTPRIDAFADVATRYSRAVASAPWTLPAHASLLTGKNPAEHGAHSFKVGDRANTGVLDESHLTLAEALSAEGFRSAALTGNAVYLNPRFKLGQGFESYFNARTYARSLTRMVVEWLREHGEQQPDTPFFLFLNYVDTHNPYNAGKRRGGSDFLEEGRSRNSFRLYEELRPHILKRESPFPDEKVRHLIDLYDTALFNLDAELGYLFRTLEKLGLYDDTLTILTSDHGEYFGEHDLIDHGKDVYQEVLAVPLIIKYPGQREGRVDDIVVSGAHIAHMVVSELPPAMAERNLRHFPKAPGRDPAISENYFTMPYDYNRNPWERARFNRVRTALYDWPYKYIHDSSGAHELYDLEADPAESDDLHAREPEVAQRLAKRLAAAESGRSQKQPLREVSAPDAEQIENLRALGYLSAEPSASDPEPSASDPEPEPEPGDSEAPR